MTHPRQGTLLRAMALAGSVLALAACESDGNFDYDLRNFGSVGLDTTAAARAAQPRPQPDSRGVITYPNYQIAIARPGDTVATVANRIGISPGELARYNAIQPDTPLRTGEVLALPVRVPGELTTAPASGTGTGGRIDVTTIASSAIDRAEGQAGTAAQPSSAPLAPEPVRHRVARGETAYSIARLYNVPVKALADWNGLGPDLALREGQTLIIPVTTATPPAPTQVVTPPGTGSPTPVPPSATKPLPQEKTEPAAKPVEKPKQPDLGSQQTAASNARLAMPVQGKIIRGYSEKTKGIDIAAAAGTPVRAAEAGQVAVITKDTKEVTVIVLRHEGNLLTFYANVGDVKVKKGDRVSRGQVIATVANTDPAFLRFGVSEGANSVDPTPYLK
ncbi:murein DD-endopeptidase MepM/ murein hydrolase activator NlpD [Albidovulum inexpectatum]|uniref:Murein DD-endopeptidase MepM/ murein hydrolase activator NlpD n=1 Tax=Albidovulum inexpectatum TaxID=196587 RepID=A0A2S5JK10_9RHOB|nr:LysM peptidoglycan-binding domain-containing protein [Albidovulum inexpectatum]PPB81790.1 murein DD-endopeptidase MepM/ murein hydrolase activator NlpD [Albidovulum inexpectatum]